ncbi:PALP domain-containing protein [Mycena venus]|uniref:PALP domain-containing protein n=1 Tax=Mycena venus TaxID=2733690 RepID=A0A8H6YLB4_9AGAR|nr:PALP domain-containing protein [Mycena venus]
MLSAARTVFRRGFASSAAVEGFTGAVGNTPLIYLKHLSEKTGSRIFGKAEFQNPGGSVKDRAALGVVRDAEDKGASQEKIDLLRMLGAEVHAVPAVAYENPANYNHQARDHAKALTNAIWTNQFDNTANAQAHYISTGPEIWEQTRGELDGFICSTGTGGDASGDGKVSQGEEWGEDTDLACGSAGQRADQLHHQRGKADRAERQLNYRRYVCSIGQGRITDNLATFVNDLSGAFTVPDEKSIQMVYELLDTEGLYLGASSALNVVAAVELALKLGKGSNVVTILADGAYRYQSRLFSKKWLESKGLEGAIPQHLKKYAVLD